MRPRLAGALGDLPVVCAFFAAGLALLLLLLLLLLLALEPEFEP